MFVFPKGYLEKASAGEVEDTIGEVFSIPNEEPQAEVQQQDQQQQQPVTIQLGMTTGQVGEALSKPGKIFDLGAKQV
jgi:hypothetical protein